MGVRRRDLARRVRRLPGDRSGNVIIYVSLIAAVLLGIIGLALDASRAMISKSEAQAAADAAALAAAAQLDGSSDSVARAIAAAQTLIENDQRFAEGSDGSKVTIADIRFLETLPASDADPLSDYTTDPADARFVEVVTEGLEHTNLFLVVLGVARNATVGASAVAGFKSVMCRIPPVFICNPDEVDSTSNPTWDPTGWEGRQIRAKAGSGNTQWAPGNFGLLDMFGANGASQIADLIARVDTSNRCFAASGVDTSPGNKVSIRNGLNVRFDIYNGSFNGLRSNPQYRPARNVTIDGGCNSGGGGGPPPGKGGGGGGGGGGTPTSSWFPRDNNVTDANPFGNGIWVTSCASWWATNHTSSPPAGCTSDPSTTTVTRYDLYRYEIDTPDMPNRGAPRCYSGGSGTLSDSPDRRIMYMAVVNCRYHDIRGNEESVPTVGFIKGFLTEPMPDMGGGNTETNDEQGVIYLEVVEAMEAGTDDEVMRDDVQLYR